MRPGNSAPSDLRCLCATVRRASRLLSRRYEEALRPSGLTPAQFELLMNLRHRGPHDQTELSALLDTDQTTLSRNLRPLLRQRWVVEERDDKDGRRRVYRLTPLGQAVLGDAQRRWRDMHREIERRLGAPMSTLWPALDRILAAASDPERHAKQS